MAKYANPKLTDKQRLYIDEYLIDLNSTQAAIRAGYHPSTIYQLHQNKNVSKAIEIALAERSKRVGINQDRVLRELAKIAFVTADDVIDLKTGKVRKDATKEDLSCIQSVKMKPNEYGLEREVKLHDKLKALELLGKHLGTFMNDQNINITGTVKFVDDI